MNIDNIPNSEISRLIDEYIRNAKYRYILKDRLIDGLTYSEIAEKHNYSDSQIKRIIHKTQEQFFKHL